MGQKQKTEKKAKEREREKERKLVITMASYALQSHLGWCMQAAWGNNIGQLCIVNASSGGAHNPPSQKKERLKVVITLVSYALQTSPRVAHAKPPGPINFSPLYE